MRICRSSVFSRPVTRSRVVKRVCGASSELLLIKAALFGVGKLGRWMWKVSEAGVKDRVVRVEKSTRELVWS